MANRGEDHAQAIDQHRDRCRNRRGFSSVEFGGSRWHVLGWLQRKPPKPPARNKHCLPRQDLCWNRWQPECLIRCSLLLGECQNPTRVSRHLRDRGKGAYGRFSCVPSKLSTSRSSSFGNAHQQHLDHRDGSNHRSLQEQLRWQPKALQRPRASAAAAAPSGRGLLAAR